MVVILQVLVVWLVVYVINLQAVPHNVVLVRTGSFIKNDGVAITIYHFIAGVGIETVEAGLVNVARIDELTISHAA
jgi:hypothetical protein